MPLSDDEIKEYLNERGATVSSDARSLILETDNPKKIADRVADKLHSRIVISEGDVRNLVDEDELSNTRDSVEDEGDLTEEEQNKENSDEVSDGLDYREKIRGRYIRRITKETAATTEEFEGVSESPEDDIEIFDQSSYDVSRNSDKNYSVPDAIADRSESQGNIEDFAAYFKSRYRKLSSILEDRVSARKIGTLDNTSRSDSVSVIGIVVESRTTRSENSLIELEDPTGKIPVVFSDDEQIEKCEHVIEDEVIAVQGQLSDDGGIIYGDRLFFPDVPPRRRPNTSDREAKAALISDLHFGAKEMAFDKWNKFIDWIHKKEEIEYLLIAGDIIEGVGIYSGQKDQLSVSTIKAQYELCSLALEQLPDDIKIIITPGNHDGIPQAEPQPSFPEKFVGSFPENVEFSGNPALVEVEGVKILMYHGVSIFPFIDLYQEGDPQSPADGMWPMLQKRHIAPMYGEGIRILPEKEDNLVIEEIPDIIHSGHIHTVDIDSYNSVKLLNTGAWQHQTDYQERMDIDPDVGYCFVVDLESLDVKPYAF